MPLKSVAPKFFFPALLPALLLALLSALLWGCVTSAEDNGKYSGTLGDKNREYQTDTVLVDDCRAQADSAIDWTTWDCGYDCSDSTEAAVTRVNARLGASCKESGGRRDTLYLVLIDNGMEFFSVVDKESYTDTAIEDEGYFRARVAAIPYHSSAYTKVEKTLMGDYFVVKTPSLTEESDITVECYSEADLTPGYRQWWPADFESYTDLKEVDLTPGGGVCEEGDKYRVTVTNP